ncbi:MAG: hypothetical protein GXY58_08160 [Planctomycetaceae bacterium]|nr:hypothetical protein [Planctomycetaceae bacterium]
MMPPNQPESQPPPDTSHADPFDLSDALPAEPIAMQAPSKDAIVDDVWRAPAVKGAAPPPDRTQSEGTEQGIRAPGFESIQSANDVAGAMHNYQAQLVSTLTTITQVLIETTSRLEQLENYLDRLR